MAYTPAGSTKSTQTYIPAGGTTTSIAGQKLDLSSSEGLYQAATSAGLKDRADSVLATKGEEVKKIFSGGFVSDIFDTLNALQYGVVGVLKGKGFMEGIKTRQSFSDQDALGDNGLPGIIGGIALDIAVDPLTYIAPWTILKKVGVAPKLAKAAKIAEQTKIGKYFGNKFVYRFGQDPVYKKLAERSIKNIGQGTQNLADMVKKIAKIKPETAAKLLTKDATGRFIRKPLEQVRGVLSPDEFADVSKAYSSLDDLGKQAVDLNLLGKGTFEQNYGEYIKTAFTEFELSKKKGIFGIPKKLGIKRTSFIGRQDAFGVIYQPAKFTKQLTKKFTTKEARDAFASEILQKGGIINKKFVPLSAKKLAELGQIDNPAYLLFKSSFDLFKDVENAKLFNVVAKRWGKEATEEGLKQLPKGQRLGDLAGKWVPENIFNDIQEIARPMEMGFGKKVVAGFKFGKVIMNPATHARNIISNKTLNWWKLGMNPLDPRTVKAEAAALQEIFKKGGKFTDEAKTVGYNLNTFVANELRGLLESPQAMAFGKSIPNWRKAATRLGNIYQGEENYAKLAGFIFNRNKGLGIEDAWKAAEAATFNYAQVTPFIRKVRESLFGFPFITFAYKAAPIAVETAVKYPRRISALGKIKGAIENMSDIKETTAERATEPAWVRDGFYIKLPIKDENGRSSYFDLTYIIPFGDLISGQFFTRQVGRETGLPESVPETLIEKSPFFNTIKEISKNQDFYGNRVWKEGDSVDQQLKDLFRHLTKTYLPPLLADQIPGGYDYKGEQREGAIARALTPAEKENQRRTLMQEMLRNVGLKTQPISADIQETYMEWEKKKALTTLLQEAGVVGNFEIPYAR